MRFGGYKGFKSKRDWQRTYNVTLRRYRVMMVVVEKK
jgi:hypothetical protein